MDVTPVGDAEEKGEDQKGRRQLLEMAREAERLKGDGAAVPPTPRECIVDDAEWFMRCIPRSCPRTPSR